jgi:hypothetical protein
VSDTTATGLLVKLYTKSTIRHNKVAIRWHYTKGTIRHNKVAIRWHYTKGTIRWQAMEVEQQEQ